MWSIINITSAQDAYRSSPLVVSPPPSLHTFMNPIKKKDDEAAQILLYIKELF